jgi:hypothetical protein
MITFIRTCIYTLIEICYMKICTFILIKNKNTDNVYPLKILHRGKIKILVYFEKKKDRYAVGHG